MGEDGPVCPVRGLLRAEAAPNVGGSAADCRRLADVGKVKLALGVRRRLKGRGIVVVVEHDRQPRGACILGLHSGEVAAFALLDRVAVGVLVVPEIDDAGGPVDLNVALVVVARESLARCGAPVGHRTCPVLGHSAGEVGAVRAVRAAAEVAVRLRFERALGRVDEGARACLEQVVARVALLRGGRGTRPGHVAAARVHQ
mmetsp:Transcript_60297/g.165219  ORF Transcript_60297/g.165219 Transcript_60297/m.165219 type:complete len:200 (+) Transcript_60297:187-786(+)